MATYSSILAWKIPWTRGACQGMVHGVAKSPCMHTHGVLRPETKDLSDALLSTSGPSDSPCWAWYLTEDGRVCQCSEFFFFRQGFIGAPVAAGGNPEQTSPLACLLPKVGASLFLIWGEGWGPNWKSIFKHVVLWMNFLPHLIDLELGFSMGDSFAPFSSTWQGTCVNVWRRFGWHSWAGGSYWPLMNRGQGCW